MNRSASPGSVEPVAYSAQVAGSPFFRFFVKTGASVDIVV